MEEYQNNEDKIDLMNLFKVFLKRKWMILGLVSLLTSVAIIIALLIPNTYRSDGFFVISDDKIDSTLEPKTSTFESKISIPEYKRYSRLFLQKSVFFSLFFVLILEWWENNKEEMSGN